KGSAAARMWAWKRLKLRYALDPAIVEHRAFLAGMQDSADPSERGLLCFLMFARTDRLFREVTFEYVSPHLEREGTEIEPAIIEVAIRERAEASSLQWSGNTLDRAGTHLLAALKDFGLIRGSRPRRTVRPRLGVQVTLFAARLGHYEGLTDRQVLDSRWFRLFGLERDQVVDLFYVATRFGVLDFRMQADVVELRLPPLEEKIEEQREVQG
ncbi:MAG TPA: BrxA family protein, partial [Chloroflexota bacterium]|nr:BrxA family protein [Chloroflexota bacterium]